MISYYSYHEPICITFKSDDEEAAFSVDPMQLSSETPDSSIDINQSVSSVKSNQPEPSVKTNQSRPSVKSQSGSKHPMTTAIKLKKTSEKAMTQSNISTDLGYEADGLIPQFPLPTYNTHVIPEHVLQSARNICVRIIDMWGGNQSAFQLSSWLKEIGINVIQTITNEQIGLTCGYIAAHVAWLLHDNTEWQTQDVSSALYRNMIVEYNAVLNQPLARPTYLTDNQILDVLTHLHFSSQDQETCIGSMDQCH